jgi:hypothetical protein
MAPWVGKALQEIIGKATCSDLVAKEEWNASDSIWNSNNNNANSRHGKDYHQLIQEARILPPDTEVSRDLIVVNALDKEVHCQMSPPMVSLFLHSGFGKDENFYSHLQPKINVVSNKVEEMNETIGNYLLDSEAPLSSQQPQVMFFSVKQDSDSQSWLSKDKRAIFTDTVDNPMHDDMTELELQENETLSVHACAINDLVPFYQVLLGVSNHLCTM